MVFSYYPGCTLKNKAKDLDNFARMSAKRSALLSRKFPSGSVAAEFILWLRTKSQRNFHLFAHL